MSQDSLGRPLPTISGENPRTRKGFGPPPFEYWRIVGETMPPEAYALEPAAAMDGPMQWSFVGARPVTNEYWSGGSNAGGRVVSIACHPTDPATAYIATASGGIWKTTNTGGTWSPMTDAQPNLNHGAVEVDSAFPQTVYAGTGEYTTGSSGNGLMRSLDGGQSWTLLTSSAMLGSRCSGIVVVPGASASAPAAIHWTGPSGYKRSVTAAASWATPLAGDCSSLAVDRTNPLRVFVAKAGVGIYRSVNGGMTFGLLSGGLPATGFSRIVIAIGRSDPQVLYAAFVNSSGGLAGFYRTADGGTTWAQLTNTPNFPTPQGWYDLSVGVDPANANHVYCGGVSPLYQVAGVIETTNGGQSWTEISGTGGQIHPDQHWVSFGADGVPWFGCDGGVWRRVSGQWVNLNATLAAIQNYTIAQHPNDPGRMMAGTQDNGSAGTSSGALAWPQIVGGDGGYGAYDPAVFNRLYTTYVYLRTYRVVNGNATDISGAWNGDDREWIAPLVIDPNSSTTLYGGTNRLWRTTNASTGASWTAVSTSQVADGGTVTAVAPTKNLAGAIWVGNSAGGIWRTTNGGASWTQVLGTSGGRVTGLCVRPGSTLEAIASFNVSSGIRVRRTTDGGATWSSVTGQLPIGVSATTLAVDWARPVPTLYLGSGAGIYASFTLGNAWIKDGAEFPNVNIGQLEIDAARRTIAVGTYGRGAWRSPMPHVADINADGVVDGADLGLLLGAWGTCPAGGQCPADLNQNGIVDGADLGLLLAAFGT